MLLLYYDCAVLVAQYVLTLCATGQQSSLFVYCKYPYLTLPMIE